MATMNLLGKIKNVSCHSLLELCHKLHCRPCFDSMRLKIEMKLDSLCASRFSRSNNVLVRHDLENHCSCSDPSVGEPAVKSISEKKFI